MLIDTQVFGRGVLAQSGFQSVGAWLVGLAIAGVFAVDCLTPLGIGIPFFYLLVLWISLVRATPRQALAVTAACSVLTVIALFLSPEGDLRTGFTNRAITLVALWFLAYFGTAYRKNIDTLSRRERELTDFVENAPVGIHWVDPDGMILWANQEELATLGYDRNEYVGRSVIDFHVDREVAEDILVKLNANRPVKDCAARLRHKDGSIRHVLISCNVYQEEDRFIHSRCFTQDITDRVRAELAESESRQLTGVNARLIAEVTERRTAEEALLVSEQRLRLVIDDQERLSQNLHDHIIQTLYAIGMQLEECRRFLHEKSRDAARILGLAISGLNGVMRDVRHYASGSEPQDPAKPGLHAELARLVNAIGATGTLRLLLKLDPSAVVRLTPQQAEHVLHIAREALSNALRHAHAQHAELSLDCTDGGVRLEISDDGAGFDPDAPGRYAGGLHNMQSRARQIGERLEIRSSPGQGTTIILRIPQENTSHDG